MKTRFICSVVAACLVLFTSACGPKKTADSGEAGRIAAQLDADFVIVRKAAEKFALDLAALYPRRTALAAKADPSLYAFAPNGAFHKTVNDGGAALWISAALPITPELRELAYFTEAIDPELIRICRELPGVSQAYYNDRHSLNRIYPWFDTLAQYPPRMNIPDFNFYYLADAAHNPGKGGVWVEEPYVDPAGRGWMVSSIAPVYVNDFLEGVVGFDVTIETLVARYFKDTARSLAILSKEGVLVAATETAIQDLQMPPLKNHKYLETVKLDTFKPDEYNIRKSTVRSVRAMSGRLLDEGLDEVPVELGGHARLARAARLRELDWLVVEFTHP
jgi:hypothetical protein